MVVVIFILVVLVGYFGIFTGSKGGSRETAYRVKCAMNLRQIGQAMLLYANDHQGALPMVRTDPSVAPTSYTGAAATQPFDAAGPAANDVSASLFLLLSTQDLTPDRFACPSANDDWNRLRKKPFKHLSNFASERELSYSFHNFHRPAKPPTLNELLPDFAVAADMNPGAADLLNVGINSSAQLMRKINSLNHALDGQNVLYGDGYVEFQNNPYVGVARDNIYTFGPVAGATTPPPARATPGDGIVGAAVDVNDSVVLPVLGMSGVAPSTAADRWGNSAIVLIALTLIGLAGLVVRWASRQGR